jgi:hypothetical protein
MADISDKDGTRRYTDEACDAVRVSTDDQAKQLLDCMWHKVGMAVLEGKRNQLLFLVHLDVLRMLQEARLGCRSPIDWVDGRAYLFGIPVTTVTNYKPWQLVVEVE